MWTFLTLHWLELGYVCLIPLFTFAIDIGMRRLMYGRLEFLEYCYGADMGLAGVVAALTILPNIKGADGTVVSFAGVFAFLCWVLVMWLHQAMHKWLERDRRLQRFVARVALLLVANLVGLAGFAAVLFVQWQYR